MQHQQSFEMNEIITKRHLLDLIRKRNLPALEHADKILTEIYEAPARPIETMGQASRYGCAFALHPEFMFQLMTHCLGKTIVELGAASGEHCILFGCAGAKHIYVNDIEPMELEKFKDKLKPFSRRFKKKFTLLPGDCFDQLRSLPEGSIDILYLRNLFHFFKPSQYDEFFKLTKIVLKPNGILAMSVHSLPQEIPSSAPHDATCFYSNALIFDNILKAGTVLKRTLSICDDLEKDPLDYENDVVVNFKDNKYELVCDIAQKMPKDLFMELISYLNENRDNFAFYTQTLSAIRFLRNVTIRFNCRNLRNLILRQDFQVLNIYDIDYQGHIFQDIDSRLPTYKTKTISNHIGVIATSQ